MNSRSSIHRGNSRLLLHFFGFVAGLAIPALLQAGTGPVASTPSAGWSFVISQSYVSAVSYALVLGGLVLAIWHALLVSDLFSRLTADENRLRLALTAAPESPIHRNELESLTHPAARVLLILERNPGVRASTAELLDTQTLKILKPVSNRIEGNQGRSVFFGFLGTLLGILCGAMDYDKSNTGALLQNIGLAMITTMIGGIAAEIEASNMRRVESLHLQLLSERPANIERLSQLTPQIDSEEADIGVFDPSSLTNH